MSCIKRILIRKLNTRFNIESKMSNTQQFESILYLDDVRVPQGDNITHVRNYDEFVQYLQSHPVPELISLDHDLSIEHLHSVETTLKHEEENSIPYDTYKEKTGLDAVKWLISNKIPVKNWQVHSANAVGGPLMASLLREHYPEGEISVNIPHINEEDTVYEGRVEDGYKIGSYSAYVLTDETRDALLKAFPPKFPDVIAHHITIELGGKTPPEAADIQVVGRGSDDSLEALVVAINGHTKRPDGSTYHITWSLDRSKGRKPVDSNKVLEFGWEPVEPIDISTLPQKLAAYGNQEIYTSGRCHIFSLALNEAMNYQMEWLFDKEAWDDEGDSDNYFIALVHAYVLTPSGKKVDATGIIPNEVDIESEYGDCNRPDYQILDVHEANSTISNLKLPKPRPGEIDTLVRYIKANKEKYSDSKLASAPGSEVLPDGPVDFFEPVENPHTASVDYSMILKKTRKILGEMRKFGDDPTRIKLIEKAGFGRNNSDDDWDKFYAYQDPILKKLVTDLCDTLQPLVSQPDLFMPQRAFLGGYHVLKSYLKIGKLGFSHIYGTVVTIVSYIEKLDRKAHV